MQPLQIKETCIYVAELDRTQDFYAGFLGLPLISRIDGRHIFFRAGKSVLLCFLAEATEKLGRLPPHGATGSIHFAFEVTIDDYDAVKSDLSDRGLSVIAEETWRGGLRSFYFHDPDGHLVEIIEEGVWGT